MLMELVGSELQYLVDPSRCGRSWGCGTSRSYDGSIENVVRSRICGVSCGGSCTIVHMMDQSKMWYAQGDVV